MRDLEVYLSKGKNPMQYWYKIRNPLRVIINFLIIFICRYLPSLMLKNMLYRLLGMKIGKDVSVGLMVMFDIFFPEQIEIGNDVRIAAGTVIIGHMRPGKELRENYLPTRVAKVKIEDHSFIGINCVIMPGVKIKEGSVIVSGSIVMSNTKKYTVFSGNPAKKLKELTPLKTEDVG